MPIQNDSNFTFTCTFCMVMEKTQGNNNISICIKLSEWDKINILPKMSFKNVHIAMTWVENSNGTTLYMVHICYNHLV